MKHGFARLLALVCLVSCTTAAAFEVWSATRFVEISDQNGDGRPDVWRHFDRRGQLTKVDVDTNFDGKPDVEEYYVRGVLVRRESDRNFNGQADLIEEFDATEGQTRSVIDVDFDGTADLLVLFRDGRPVFSKRTRSTPPDDVSRVSSAHVRYADVDQLLPLTDPFALDLAVRGNQVRPDDDACVGLSTSGGLPLPGVATARPFVAAVRVAAVADVRPALTLRLPRSPRAPPLA